MKLAERCAQIAPFYVMEVAKAAAAWQRARTGTQASIALNIGEPDFGAAPLVQEAACRAVHDGQTQYTPALGLSALRERIAQWYAQRFGVTVDASRIVVTAGASAALQLVCLALLQSGDRVLMPDPSYPCNRNFVRAADAEPVLLPCDAQSRYQLDAAAVDSHWCAHTRAVLLASPSNPTGTSIHPDALRRLHEVVRARGGVTVIDEIYLGLSYDATFGRCALTLGDDIISINSFSKYFGMTGWRLGWIVAPPALVPVLERLAQNLYICPSTIAQHAALACFEPESLSEFERRRAEFRARRDLVVPALQSMGLQVPVTPDGAFYVWADCAQSCGSLGLRDSWDWCFALLDRTGVAVAPGRDFGEATTARFVRLSIASARPALEEALQRMRGFVQG